MSYSIKLSPPELQVLKIVQTDLPATLTPFKEIAKQVNLKEEAVLELLKKLKSEGYIRRFGATLRHQKAGYSQNAMVAWYVPSSKVENVAKTFTSRPEITHCYERKSTSNWPYNIYTMIHATTKKECQKIIHELSNATGITQYEVLESIEELKKTSMQYF
ncbi:siroheme decarboxylase subunit beta [Desulfonauticus submarinus]